jgi:hypothetical protein
LVFEHLFIQYILKITFNNLFFVLLIFQKCPQNGHFEGPEGTGESILQANMYLGGATPLIQNHTDTKYIDTNALIQIPLIQNPIHTNPVHTNTNPINTNPVDTNPKQTSRAWPN